MTEGGAQTVVVAGATGDIGGRIARALRGRGAEVVAVVRRGSKPDKLEPLRASGIQVAEIDMASAPAVAESCRGAACVVSALSGLRDTIVEAQTVLLDGAVAAGVPRFIPSDYSIDFTTLPTGSNRNFDLRREFHDRLAQRPIAATSIYNGAFADMLFVMPVILPRLRRVAYWGDPDQRMDFTTREDAIGFTAAAALDPDAPRALHVAGDRVSARDLAAIASEIHGAAFGLMRVGSPAVLAGLIKLLRTVRPGQGEVFPVWQAMQYMHNMFSGEAPLPPLDNDRYPGIAWTKVRDVLKSGS